MPVRSRFADTFNHDADAADYDADVRHEAHPIRAGYSTVLEWVAQTAQVGARNRNEVLELGAGTGNLTTLLARDANIVAVDISAQMLEIARNKITREVRWVHDDILAFFDNNAPLVDRVVSTYAIHHLVADEKRLLMHRVRDCLQPGGRAVFGDLMFESAQSRQEALRKYAADGWTDVAEAIEQEFFWLLDESVAELLQLGFRVSTRRFSDLSWGLCATL